MGYVIVGIIITLALFFGILALLIGAHMIGKIIEIFTKGRR